MSEIILNPCGRVEPAHDAQMWLDPSNEVLYQARGKTALDWHLVPPADLSGSFVKVYDFFLGPAWDGKPQPEGYAQHFRDSETVKATMRLDGLRLEQALSWTTWDGVEVAMVRLKFDRHDGLTTFFGFTADSRAHQIADGTGFRIDDDIARFSDNQAATLGVLQAGETVTLRVEIDRNRRAIGFMNDTAFDVTQAVPESGRPVVAMFNRRPGTRRVAPGYEAALQRTLRG
jgi:hypothetical protein